MANKRKNKPRVYARLVSLSMLIKWHTSAILLGIAIQLMFAWYHHEMTVSKLDGMVDTTVKLVKICNSIGVKDCNTVRKILKGKG